MSDVNDDEFYDAFRTLTPSELEAVERRLWSSATVPPADEWVVGLRRDLDEWGDPG